MVSASGVFGISVTTATLVWLPQNVLLFEVIIMHFLNTIAFLTLLYLAMSAIGFYYSDDSSIRDDEIFKQGLIIVIRCIVKFELYVTVCGTVTPSKRRPGPAPKELVSNCRPYHNILPGFPKDDPNVMEGIKRYADAIGYGYRALEHPRLAGAHFPWLLDHGWRMRCFLWPLLVSFEFAENIRVFLLAWILD